MTAAAEWARSFACPYEGSNRNVVHDIVATHASAYASEFLNSFGGLLEIRAPGLLPVLKNRCESEITFDDAWSVAAGYMRRAVLDSDDITALQFAATFALDQVRDGWFEDWEAAFAAPIRLRLGHWLLPRTDSIRVASVPHGAKLSLRYGNRWRRAAIRVDGRRRTVEGAQRLPSGCFYGFPIMLVERPALDGLSFGTPLTMTRLKPNQVLPKIAKSFKVIRDHAPRYSDWISDVLRGVIPLHAQFSEIRSGSDADKPGIVQASFPIRTEALAETWIHECAHQYFQTLSRVGGVDDGTDHRLYYSPIRQLDRPIDKILLAYHAFANVLLFYRTCRRSGMRTEYLERNELRLVPQLRQLEAHLRSTTALTDLGLALFEPLAERIAI